jgi:subtilisin family serine protease
MKHCLAAIMMAVVLLSCTREEILPVEPNTSTDVSVETTDEFVCGEARVFLSEEMTAMVEEAIAAGSIQTKSSAMNSALEELGITEMYRLFPHAGQYEGRTRREGLHRWYVVKYSQEVALTKAQSSLEMVDGIELFEPVRQIKINDFNDLSSDLWGLYNASNPGFDINVKPVWNEFTTGSSKVVVSVVDTGVDLNHEDLAANCLSTGHYNAVSENTYIEAGEHGTHVAGTIAAVSNNGKGVAGIAGGDKAKGISGVKVMSSQIFGADGRGTGKASSVAIKRAADDGAIISQNSWGYNYDSDGDGQLSGQEYTNAMNARIQASDKAAVDYFIKYAGCDDYGNQLAGSPMKGGVVIFAAGNDGIENGAPASYENVIAVGSVTKDGKKSSFSNYGAWVDICAPGSSIMSTIPGNQYGNLSGTSMACPHVSGVAALLVSYFGGPGFTNEMLKEKLLNSSNKAIISQYNKIGGLVDAYGAFVYGNDKAPAAVTDLTASGRGNNIDLTWTPTVDEDGKAAYGYLAIYGKDEAKVKAATPSSLEGVETTSCAPDVVAGEKARFTVSRLDFEAKYYVKMLAYSYGRSYSDATGVIDAVTTENHAPVVNVVYDGEISILSSQTVNVPVSVSDPDDHEVEIVHESASEAETFERNIDGNWRLVINGSKADVGTYQAKITATDEFGMSTVVPVTYTIRENSAPEKIKEIENVLLTAKGREFIIDMTEHVYDRDPEQLKYDIQMSSATIAHITSKGDRLIGTSLGYGSVDVTVTAKDARGEKVVFTFKVTVKDPADPVSVYPNPVVDYANVATMDLAETEIAVYSATGTLMVITTPAPVSALQPAVIDMRSYPPGVYTMLVRFGGEEYKETVVKL